MFQLGNSQFSFGGETILRILSLVHDECCRASELDLMETRLIAQNLINAVTFLSASLDDINTASIFLIDSIFQYCCRDSLRSEYGAAFVYIEQLYKRFLGSLITHLAPSSSISLTLTQATEILTNMFNTKCQAALYDITSFNFDQGVEGPLVDRSFSEFLSVHNFVHRHAYFATAIVWKQTQQYFER